MIKMKESILWKDFEKQEKSLKLEFFPTVLAFKMFEEEAKKKSRYWNRKVNWWTLG